MTGATEIDAETIAIEEPDAVQVFTWWVRFRSDPVKLIAVSGCCAFGPVLEWSTSSSGPWSTRHPDGIAYDPDSLEVVATVDTYRRILAAWAAGPNVLGMCAGIEAVHLADRLIWYLTPFREVDGGYFPDRRISNTSAIGWHVAHRQLFVCRGTNVFTSSSPLDTTIPATVTVER